MYEHRTCCRTGGIDSRKDMVEIFRHVLHREKVFLVSDMYLTAQMLEPILEKNGIAGYRGSIFHVTKTVKAAGTIGNISS